MIDFKGIQALATKLDLQAVKAGGSVFIMPNQANELKNLSLCRSYLIEDFVWSWEDMAQAILHDLAFTDFNTAPSQSRTTATSQEAL